MLTDHTARMSASLPVEIVPERSVEIGQFRFLAEGLVASRIVRREDKDIVRFGELSEAALLVFGFVVVAAVAAVPLLAKSTSIPLPVAAFPLAGVLLAYGLFFARQRSLKGIELELSPKRCVLRNHETTQVIDGIEAVVVVNSHQFRNGSPATEGVSELFLQTDKHGDRYFVPIASEGNYGECDDLARAIAKSLRGKLRIVNRE